MIDMRGKIFGRLTVLAMTEHRNA
ncbi:AP2 domain-containing protein, partial [Pediococcus acidilactici]